MTIVTLERLPANPFTTRHTRPGALPPLDALGRHRDVPRLVSLIRSGGGSAAIEGPHGTGKSTLLAAIAGELAASGCLAGHLTLRRRRDAAAVFRAIAAAGNGATVCVDGWERLVFPLGWIARLLAATRNCGLIVTTHRRAGMPLAVRTAASGPLLARIVELLPDHGGRISHRDVAVALDRHGGNLRESLADLYDRFESLVRRCDRS